MGFTSLPLWIRRHLRGKRSADRGYAAPQTACIGVESKRWGLAPACGGVCPSLLHTIG
jgi:hypothetical protein